MEPVPGVLAMWLLAPFVGGTMNAIAERYPKFWRVLIRRPRCHYCARQFNPSDLLPVIGWVRSRGRCGRCGSRLASAMLLMPAVALGLAFASIFVKGGMLAWISVAFCFVLMLASEIDRRHKVLPLTLAVVALAAGLGLADFTGVGGTREAGLGAGAAAAGYLAVVSLYGALVRRADTGLSHLVLAATAGAWTGLGGLPAVALITLGGWAAGKGIERVSRAARIAPRPPRFASYLTLAILLVWFLGPRLGL